MDALRTERLILRPFRGKDLPLYAALNAHPQVADALGGPLSREDSDDIALWGNECWGPDGFGLVAVERAEDGVFLGMCGLHRHSSRPQDVEVGWRLDPAYWGHGYATEAGRAWLAHGFGTLGLERIISMTDEPNVRSLAVMRRLGLTYLEKDQIRDGDTWFEAVVYAITAEEFAAAGSAPVRSG
jgi:RimJ/RimL family protein N-acetyltransferase